MTVGAAMTVTVAQWQRSFYALTLVSRSKPVSFFFFIQTLRPVFVLIRESF
jgi:hypothetical protein